MEWDIAKPFVIDIKVKEADLDELEHVNNAVYVQWLEQCAWQHSGSLGLDLTLYKELNRAMVVIRHEIDYLGAAYCYDELLLGTWITHSDQRLKLTRQFQLIRPSDNATLLRAKTLFCCVEFSSNKPKKMPKAFIEGYGAVVIETL